MDIDVTLSGYRCFSPQHPVTLSLRSDIVALVGVNNSGKSTLLKSVYEFRDVFTQLSQPSGGLTAALNQGSVYKRSPEIGDQSEVFWHFGKSDLLIDIVLPTAGGQAQPAHIWKAQVRVVHGSDKFFVSFFDLDGKLSDGKQAMSEEDSVMVGGSPKSLVEMFRACQLLSQCFYFPSVRHVTSFTPESGGDGQGKFYDIFSGKPFIDAWAHRQQGGGKFSTQDIRAITNDIKKIFRYQDLVIQAGQGHRELLVVADGKSMRLGELGTGLAQFVLLLGNIAFANPSYVFIDEPESNLHPSLQLRFMKSVASRASFGVVFATHSLGLARQSANRTFALTRNAEYCEMTELSDTPNLAQLVGELSFGRADSLGTRHLLLVEGASDILTYQALLSVLDKDHEFAILSLGGSSLINPDRERELEHVIAISPITVAIIDSERDSADRPVSKDRVGFVEVCKRLGIRCHVLERCAIENYLSESAIHAAFPGAPYRELGQYERMRNMRPSWEKKDNWRIAERMVKSEIAATDLGRFLDSL